MLFWFEESVHNVEVEVEERVLVEERSNDGCLVDEEESGGFS